MNPSQSKARQRGFTLVELMISVALGLLLMVALVAVYLNVSRTNTEMAKTNSLIENGRFAMDILTEDLLHVGYWGGYVPEFDNFSSRTVPTGTPTQAAVDLGPCLAFASWTPEYHNMLIGAPIQTFADVPAGCGTVVDKKADTDVLIVRHAETCLPGAANCDADAFAGAAPYPVYFQASFCEIELTAGRRYQLSNVPADFPADVAPTQTVALKQRGCTGPSATTAGRPAERRKYVANIYYVRTWAVTSGDGIPTLVRSTFNLAGSPSAPGFAGAVALIEGIESFVVQLGIDSQSRCAATAVDYTKAITRTAPANLVDPATCAISATAINNTMPTVRGDGVPESYVRCPAGGCTSAQLADVVSVKIHVLARSRETAPGHDDTKVYTLGPASFAATAGTERLYKRHVFQTTVRLTNISGRRETP